MTNEESHAAQNASHQPGLGHVLTWTAIAAAFAPVAYFGSA